jgi:hypothetical protein
VAGERLWLDRAVSGRETHWGKASHGGGTGECVRDDVVVRVP